MMLPVFSVEVHLQLQVNTCSCLIYLIPEEVSTINDLVCFQDTGFFLVVWLKLKNMTFTLPLMNESSALYQKTQDDVINEVIAITGNTAKDSFL